MDWQSISDWRLVCPPSRPSKVHLSFVQRNIEGIDRNDPVAVLGSTVEYRDLLSRLGFKNVFIIDKNISFHKTIDSIRRIKSKELLIKEDWIGHDDLVKGIKFSFILSHLTSGNIKYEDRNIFYRSIYNSLSTNGFLLDYVLTNKNGYIDSVYLFDKYKYCPINILEANAFSCEALFCSEFCEMLGMVDSSRIYDLILEEFGEGFRELVNLTELVTPRGGLWYYGKPWAQIRVSQLAYFRVVEECQDEIGSPYYERASSYRLVKHGDHR